jgi:TolA-binding protein
MTGAEMERAIEFLLQGQANHQVRFDELADKLNQLTQQVVETNRIVQLQAETQGEFIQIMTSSFERLAAAQARANERLTAAQVRADGRLAAAQAHADESIAKTNAHIVEMGTRTDERIVETNARAAATDARLDRIAAMLDRHILEGHGNS